MANARGYCGFVKGISGCYDKKCNMFNFFAILILKFFVRSPSKK